MTEQAQAIEAFTRILRIGTTYEWSKSAQSCYVKIKWDGLRLSLTGAVGPRPDGSLVGPAGQIHESLRTARIRFNSSWNAGKLKQLLDTWERWHLNDMRPGTPAQMEAIRAWRGVMEGLYGRNPDYWAIARGCGYTSVYAVQCDVLSKKGLLYDGDYKFGTAWLHEDVPADVLEWLQNLPPADRQPAWV